MLKTDRFILFYFRHSVIHRLVLIFSVYLLISLLFFWLPSFLREVAKVKKTKSIGSLKADHSLWEDKFSESEIDIYNARNNRKHKCITSSV